MWLEASIGERVGWAGPELRARGSFFSFFKFSHFFILLNVLQVVFNAVTAVTVISQGLV